jgi:hypothetical protein
MFDLNCSELNTLHLEPIQKYAAAARLLHHYRLPRPSLTIRLRTSLGNLLIRAGQRLKDVPRRLEAEPASISSWIIIL